MHVKECVRVLCSFNYGNCNSKYHNLRIVFCGLQFAKLTYERWPTKSFKLTHSVSIEQYLKPLVHFYFDAFFSLFHTRECSCVLWHIFWAKFQIDDFILFIRKYKIAIFISIRFDNYRIRMIFFVYAHRLAALFFE